MISRRLQEKWLSALCPVKTLCPRYSGLSSSYLSPVKLIIGVPGKVVYLHYTTVYCACLSVVLIAFVPLSRMLPCWERASYSAFRVCCRKMFCCVLCVFFPSWSLCWDFKFNCIDSWFLYSYFTTLYHKSDAMIDQRTIGPENAHLKPDLGVLSHHEMTLTLNTHTPVLTSQVV